MEDTGALKPCDGLVQGVPRLHSSVALQQLLDPKQEYSGSEEDGAVQLPDTLVFLGVDDMEI